MTDQERIDALAQFTDDELMTEWCRRQDIEMEKLVAAMWDESRGTPTLIQQNTNFLQ